MVSVKNISLISLLALLDFAAKTNAITTEE